MNAGLNMMSLVAGMAVGADSIEDMALFAARWHRQCVQQRVCVVGVGVVPVVV